MLGVSLVGVHQAGGTLLGLLNPRTFINGSSISVVGDSVASHPPCPAVPAHCSPVMAAGSSRTFIDGIAMIRATDPATCGHLANGLATDTDDG